jgi:hypothetical protein
MKRGAQEALPPQKRRSRVHPSGWLSHGAKPEKKQPMLFGGLKQFVF